MPECVVRLQDEHEADDPAKRRAVVAVVNAMCVRVFVLGGG